MIAHAVSLALASSLAASAAAGQGPRVPGATGRSCVRVEVSSGSPAAAPSTVVPRSPTFSATRILDLTITVLFPASTEGEHLLELRVFTPDAQLYRSLAMPVARGGAANVTRSVAGYARPLAQRPLRHVSRGSRAFLAAATTLPVGGTDVVSSGLYGRWRVEAYLDGAAERCAPAAAFTLQP